MHMARDIKFPVPLNMLKNQDKVSRKITPCVYFNKNTCNQKQSHEARGVMYRHVCSTCISADDKTFLPCHLNCRKLKA